MDIILSDEEELSHLEHVISDGLDSFYKVGEALSKVKDKKLYKLGGFTDFEDYCIEKWGMKANYARRLIVSSDTVKNIELNVPIGTLLPQTESQTRELSKVSTEDQAPIWELVNDDNNNPTAKDVRESIEVFEEVKESMPNATMDDILEVAKERKHVHVSANSGENEWYTPREFISSAIEVMGTISLDPASSEIANRTVQAGTYYTKEDDGLKLKWFGKVWLNPPYEGKLIKEFSKKVLEQEFSEIIILVNNATETQWFQDIASISSAVCFPKKRIRFLDPDGNQGAPLQGQAIIYSGDNHEAFREEFNQYGFTAIL